ncbi:MAG: CopG family transcriptional regulator [Acidimicrobiia bacterium]|nr:CopG family transcriptional regulator [Acidimicrobiia bacterium]
MRTTLNLDDDLASALAELARARARSLSRVANDLIRAGLRAAEEDRRPSPYEPPVFETGRPRVDVTDVAGTLELLDDAG